MYAAWFLESPVAVKRFNRVEDSLHEVRWGRAGGWGRPASLAGQRMGVHGGRAPLAATSGRDGLPPRPPAHHAASCQHTTRLASPRHTPCRTLPLTLLCAAPQVEMYLLLGSHDNIVALRGLCQHEGSMYLVLEYCPRCDAAVVMPWGTAVGCRAMVLMVPLPLHAAWEHCWHTRLRAAAV